MIESDPKRKGDNQIKCDFCLADNAMASGKPERKEVEIEGTVWDTCWVPVDHGICPQCAEKLYPWLDLYNEGDPQGGAE